MTNLNIVEWPASILKIKSAPVTDFGDEFQKLIGDMYETMEKASGIGLAANQVNVAKRVFTILIPASAALEPDSPSGEPPVWSDKAFTFVNPEIIHREGKIRWQEGCLSFPGISEFVERYEKVVVKAQDEKGTPFEVMADGLFAVCIQHELDHIDGIVFIDRMSRLKANIIQKKIDRRMKLQDDFGYSHDE